MKRMFTKSFWKGKKRFAVIAVITAAAVGFNMTASGMTIANFDDYNPPDRLGIDWGDYRRTANASQGYSVNNTSTAFPIWSAEYPYRTFLLGARPVSTAQQRHVAHAYVIYSKKPALDIIELSYESSARSTSKTGYIKAAFRMADYVGNDDIRIVHTSLGDMIPGTLTVQYPSNIATATLQRQH